MAAAISQAMRFDAPEQDGRADRGEGLRSALPATGGKIVDLRRFKEAGRRAL
jgi:hypothetical protein